MIHFEIPGNPVSQLRPRAVRRGKGIMMYDPKQVKEYKEYVALIARQHAPDFPLDGAISADLKFYRPIPKNTTKKDRQAMLNGNILPTVKADVDNYSKAILDSLNGIIYEDDSQVIGLWAYKYYSETPHVSVKIQEVF